MKTIQTKIIVVLMCVAFILAGLILAQLIGNVNINVAQPSSDTSVASSESSESESSEPISEISDISEAVSSDTTSEEPSETPSEEQSKEQSEEPTAEPSQDDGYEVPAYVEKQEGKKYVAFTFDDGPSVNTPALLDFLEENDMVVTFFTVGNRLNSTYGGYLKRASELGCEIGIHCYTHDLYFHKCSDEDYFSELNKTKELIYEYVGYYPITMRPPGGSITQKRVEESEYNVIIWSVDSKDYTLKSTKDDVREKNINTIVSNIINGTESEPGIRNGSIVLMHDLYENSVEAFKRVALQLKEQGYELVTVAQLCELDHTETIGKRYWSESYSK